jgi:hypothetical protein
MITKFKIFESTSDYYPGYSDDGTADWVSGIKQRVYKKINEEIRKSKKEIFSNEDPIQKIYNKWMYANIITTWLNDGMYIEPDLMKEAIKYYNEALNDPNIDKLREQERYKGKFEKQINEVLDKLKEITPITNTDYYYNPDFMK